MTDNQGFPNFHYKLLALPLPQPRIYSIAASHVNKHYVEASDDFVRVAFPVGPGKLLDFQKDRGVRNVFEGVTKLALQILLNALGMNGAFSAERA